MNAKNAFLNYINAYNAKDVNAMLTFFDEACVFENISGGKVTVSAKGKAELEALARRSAEIFLSREQKILSLTEDQNRIAAEVDFHGVVRAEHSTNMKAGGRMHVRGISVCELSDGKIIRLSDYS